MSWSAFVVQVVHVVRVVHMVRVQVVRVLAMRCSVVRVTAAAPLAPVRARNGGMVRMARGETVRKCHQTMAHGAMAGTLTATS